MRAALQRRTRGVTRRSPKVRCVALCLSIICVWNATSYKVWQIKRCNLLLMAYLDADDSHKPLCFLLLFFAVLVQMQQQRL